ELLCGFVGSWNAIRHAPNGRSESSISCYARRCLRKGPRPRPHRGRHCHVPRMRERGALCLDGCGGWGLLFQAARALVTLTETPGSGAISIRISSLSLRESSSSVSMGGLRPAARQALASAVPPLREAYRPRPRPAIDRYAGLID